MRLLSAQKTLAWVRSSFAIWIFEGSTIDWTRFQRKLAALLAKVLTHYWRCFNVRNLKLFSQLSSEAMSKFFVKLVMEPRGLVSGFYGSRSE